MRIFNATPPLRNNNTLYYNTFLENCLLVLQKKGREKTKKNGDRSPFLHNLGMLLCGEKPLVAFRRSLRRYCSSLCSVRKLLRNFSLTFAKFDARRSFRIFGRGVHCTSAFVFGRPMIAPTLKIDLPRRGDAVNHISVGANCVRPRETTGLPYGAK